MQQLKHLIRKVVACKLFQSELVDKRVGGGVNDTVVGVVPSQEVQGKELHDGFGQHRHLILAVQITEELQARVKPMQIIIHQQDNKAVLKKRTIMFVESSDNSTRQFNQTKSLSNRLLDTIYAGKCSLKESLIDDALPSDCLQFEIYKGVHLAQCSLARIRKSRWNSLVKRFRQGAKKNVI